MAGNCCFLFQIVAYVTVCTELQPTLPSFGEIRCLIPPLYGEDFVSEIPSATLHNVEEAGHMLQYEQTEAVIKILATLHN
ncbi:MAG: hypothetical protein CM1200mP9_12410 [Gammaproteobacteria bacterium]|nr:MAG: hypothetical protein CM1200mP9_12410 [Gammaproteobacteria bacterium]